MRGRAPVVTFSVGKKKSLWVSLTLYMVKFHFPFFYFYQLLKEKRWGWGNRMSSWDRTALELLHFAAWGGEQLWSPGSWRDVWPQVEIITAADSTDSGASLSIAGVRGDSERCRGEGGQ